MTLRRGELLRPNKILLATDGSTDANLAARVAADLAGKTGAGLHVAHAWTHHPQGSAYPTLVWTDYSYLFEREARRLLERQVDAIEASGTAVAEPHLLHGPPVDAILDLCEGLQPGLLVIGSRGLGPIGRLLVGSVSEGVVHHARVPVLVARGGAWPPDRVLIGDDGSGAAGRAAEIALGIGGLFGAETSLVRAHRNPPEPIGGWSARDRQRLDEVMLSEQEALAGRAEDLVRGGGSPPGTRVLDADPTLALLMVAQEQDERRAMIAVGSRGLGVIGRARLGSVSTNVLRVPMGPVLICPGPREAVRPEYAASTGARPAETTS